MQRLQLGWEGRPLEIFDQTGRSCSLESMFLRQERVWCEEVLKCMWLSCAQRE